MNEIRFFIDILFNVKFIRGSSSRYEIFIINKKVLKKHKESNNFW